VSVLADAQDDDVEPLGQQGLVGACGGFAVD
jgi:hypothetical protein